MQVNSSMPNISFKKKITFALSNYLGDPEDTVALKKVLTTLEDTLHLTALKKNETLGKNDTEHYGYHKESPTATFINFEVNESHKECIEKEFKKNNVFVIGLSKIYK